MAGKKCPNCGKWTMFETSTGRECSKCGFAVTAPINNGKGGKGYQCPICGNFTFLGKKCSTCGAKSNMALGGISHEKR